MPVRSPRLQRYLRFKARQRGDLVGAEPTAEIVAEALRDGVGLTDEVFDRFLSEEMRLASDMHWTPLRVATRAADWFAALDIKSVVDIGSGAGKFCVAAALRGQCLYTGLEQRPRLVEAARTLARSFEVEDRVTFVEGALGTIATPIADAYYFYNPFAENLFGPLDHLDEEVELSTERFNRDIAAVENFLQRAPMGTYVLTYNGFGGRIPPSYQVIRFDTELPNALRLWQKTRENADLAVSGSRADLKSRART